MDNRNQAFGILFSLCCLLSFYGCGGEEDSPEADPIINPDSIPSCGTLEPRVMQDPLTGGSFHCLWCSREWKWTIAAAYPRLFVLIAINCDRLASEAYLEIRDPQRAIVWQQPVKQGDAESHCLRYENPPTGSLTVGLYGHREFLFTTNLVEEFRGSIYLKVFDDRGDLVGFRGP